MKIQGKFSADVTAFLVKRNQAHDGKEGAVTLEIGIDQDEAVKKIGHDFHDLAFSTMRVIEAEGGDETDRVGFLQDTIKPGRSVVFPKHRIEIDGLGQTIDEQPELTSVKTCDGVRRVIAVIRIPVDASRKQLVSHLVHNIGSTLKVEFEPQQGELALQPKRGKKAEEQENDGAEAVQ